MTTYAWIVVIEQYGLRTVTDNGLDIPAAIGTRALALATTIARDSPDATVVLSHSLPDSPSYRQQLAALPASVKQTPASMEGLQDALLALHGQGTLVIYWAGHGIMIGNRRSLLCADSRDLQELRAIGVDSLMAHLRHPEFPRRQCGFFDACAQVVPDATELALRGHKAIATDQHFYFSASAAETTAADVDESGFSGTVCGLLAEHDWTAPPDPGYLWAELARRFERTPPSARFFSVSRSTGDLWDHLFGPVEPLTLDFARAARCTPDEFNYLRDGAAGCVDDQRLSDALRHHEMDSLLKELAQARRNVDRLHGGVLRDCWERLLLARRLVPVCRAAGLSWSEWNDLHDQVVANDILDKASTDNLSALLISLLDQSDPARGRDATIRLLALAVRRVRSRDHRLASDFEAQARAIAHFGDHWDDAVAELPPTDGPVFLLLGLHRDPADIAYRVVQSWVYLGEEIASGWRFTPRSEILGEQVNEAIQEVRRHYEGELTVELLTPNDLLCCDRELLELYHPELHTSTWLEEKYPVVLRWQNRMKNDDGYFSGEWSHRARLVSEAASRKPDLDIGWLDEPSSGQIVGLTFPGPSASDPGRNRPRFFSALLRGDPWMCWPRDEPDDPETFKEQVAAFVQRHGTSRATEPHALAEALRRERLGENGSLLCNLWLFIDDPKRNPYTSRFTEPVQRMTS